MTTVYTSYHETAKRILKNMRTNSKKRGHHWDPSWWSVDKIKDIISYGKCAVTGIPFDISDAPSGKRPFAPSPDRIDVSKGYNPDNVRFVVFIHNAARSDYSEYAFKTYIQAASATL